MSSTEQYTDDSDLKWALDTASTIKNLWHDGESPNLVKVLETHPGLKSHRTVVIELAYEEFCLRRKAGENLDAAKFARGFRSFERSIDCFIAVQSLVDNDPELAALQDEVAWPEPGSQFLGFDLIRELGRGAVGRVYLATERAIGKRLVVLKVALHGGHEADILGRLQHANIVPIHSIREDEKTGLTATCMPYLGEATLAVVLDAVYAKRCPPLRARAILDSAAVANRGIELQDFPAADRILRSGLYIEAVIYLGMQLAYAMAHAHARGIFHRDLKPSNILVTPDGRPLLLDFNLSVDDQHPTWRIGGTLPYMAPEELKALCEERSRPVHYDPRSDIFSLGVVLYESLAGTLPFGSVACDQPVETIADRLHQRQAKGPRPFRDHNRDVDTRLARVIESCLAFDPEQRPQSAASLTDALRRELTLVRRSRRWMVFHRKAVLAVSTAVLLMAAGVATVFALRPPYQVRQFDQAKVYYESGKDDLAVQRLNDALRVDPRWGAALVLRARVHLRRGDFQLAFADYDLADKVAPSAEKAACKGYCLSQLAQYREAASAYIRALADGLNSPAVLNNLGYSWLRLGRLDDAAMCFRRALQKNDKLQPAHHNLVVALSRLAMAGKDIPVEAFGHALRAKEIGPASGELYRNLAFFYAIASKRDASMAQAAIECVAKAVSYGIDPKTFTSDPTFAGLQANSAFQTALILHGAIVQPINSAYLIDPAGDVR